MASFLPTRRSGYFEINNSIPEFIVHYVGTRESVKRPGKRSCDEMTAEMCQTARERKLPKVHLKISTRGVTMTEKVRWKKKESFFGVSDIIYGAASKRAPGAFTFILGKDIRDKKPASYESHVFICVDTTTAKMLTLYLIKAFEVAFQEYLKHKMKKQGHQPAAARQLQLAAAPGERGGGGGGKAAAGSGSTSNGKLDQLLNVVVQSGGGGGGSAEASGDSGMKEQFKKFEEREQTAEGATLASDMNASELSDPDLQEAIEEVVGTLRATKNNSGSSRPSILPPPK